MNGIERLQEQLALYTAEIVGSDRLPQNIDPVLLGLAGEVGSILAAAKKLVREREAYPTFSQDLQEEFGDAVWYLSALCARVGIPIESVLIWDSNASTSQDKHGALFQLFELAGHLKASKIEREALSRFGHALLNAAAVFSLDINSILTSNSKKVRGAFLPLELDSLPQFDAEYPEEEQLPNQFTIKIVERASGRAHMSLNEVFIGDPLLDNVATPDGYRFHDVFHLANAAVLHWSPVTRALLKRKRKSNPVTDNTQDSGRAIVVEEGLSAWLFQRASALQFFDGATSVPYDILKAIREFVAPYEVAECPSSAWERSILQGYAAFRSLREKKRGVLFGCRSTRTLEFQDI